jgi:hypothetical protein
MKNLLLKDRADLRTENQYQLGIHILVGIFRS